MKTSKIVGPIIFWFGMLLGAHVGAQDSSAKDPYSGDFWSRSTLTGDWNGLRSELAAKGVTLDMSITQVGQGVVRRRQKRRVGIRRARRPDPQFGQRQARFVARWFVQF